MWIMLSREKKNSKKESKRNTRKQKHCNRNEECRHYWTGYGRDKNHWAQDMTIETSKTGKQRKKLK